MVTAHPLPTGSLLVKSEQERAKERVNIVQTRICYELDHWPKQLVYDHYTHTPFLQAVWTTLGQG